MAKYFIYMRREKSYYIYLDFDEKIYSGWRYYGECSLLHIFSVIRRYDSDTIDKNIFARSWDDNQGTVLLFNSSNGKIFLPEKNIQLGKYNYRYCGRSPKKRKRRKSHFREWKIIKYQGNPEISPYLRGDKVMIDIDYIPRITTDKSWKRQTKYNKQWMKNIGKKK